jgi:membrane protein required for colicin V production
MTAFDFMVIGVVGLSMVAAFLRGFVRVCISLGAWIIAVVAAVRFAGVGGGMLPDLGETPATRYVVAFALILVAVLIVGALVGYLLSRLVQAAGLGFLDRALGAIFGIARGLLIVVILVLCAGVTSAPRMDWWQNALTSRPLTTAALMLRPWLPKAWADHLDYGPKERRPAKAVVLAAR